MATRFPGDTRLILSIVALISIGSAIYGIGWLLWQVVGMVF
ncbi:hypothetical protein ATER59S_02350 [Aquamicrobium terrae]